MSAAHRFDAGYRITRWMERAGWGPSWMFQLAVALTVGTTVGLVMLAVDDASWMKALVGATLSLIPAGLAAAMALHLARTLAHSEQQRELLNVDEDLADVGSRRQFLRQTEREWARCRRYGDDGALLLIDPDFMAQVNEQLGLRSGDLVLQELTRRVADTLRQSDVLARFGRAELAVFLSHTDPTGALEAAERIRLLVVKTPFQVAASAVHLTVSVGVTSVNTGQPSVATLIEDGERALSMAKASGCNCVRAAPIRPAQEASVPEASH